MSYTLTQAEYRRAKAALTRAENKGDPWGILRTVQAARQLFEAKGFPDSWANWPRAVRDLDRFDAPDGLRAAVFQEVEAWA